jgi:penicillin-binding protein 1C
MKALGLLLATVVLLSGCITTGQIGPRPGPDLAASVEEYLQRYQPGPNPRLFQTTRFFDRHGALLAERFTDGRRTWAPLSRISKDLIDATIATEDSTFYVNTGIDLSRIASALLQNSEQGEIVSGASTITMQLARNLFLGPDQRYDQTVDRKMLEAGLAQELTTLYTKDELLEMYFNLLNYGHLAYGPEAASEVYFGKAASELTLAEATLLAGIPQQPANLDPLRDYSAAKARQRVVLDLMVRHGYLDTIRADETYREPLTFNARANESVTLAPHFIQYLEDKLDTRLGEGVTRRAGLQITTTLDLSMQELAQVTVADKVKQFQPKYDLSNGALVAMRPATGEIMAMVGSADFNNPAISGQVNVAVSSRQPGSAIKPVLYALAFDEELISPASVLWDIPVTYTVSAGQTYTPVNYDAQFHGPVTARTALANSYNIPAVKLLDGLTVDRMLEGGRAMGLRSLDRDEQWYGLSLTLGGGEVTLLELTSAYAALASGGRSVEPTSVLAITDSLGRQVSTGETVAPAQVVSPAAAFLVSDILSDNRARTPAFGAESPLKLSRPAAAKTGTTSDWRDNWTLGYTPYLVAGVWAGNSDGHPMKRTSGLTGAAPIWHDFMEGVLATPSLLADLGAPTDPSSPEWGFQPVSGVEQRQECPPGLACREGGEFFTTEWLAAAGEAGSLADSVQRVASAPIYVNRGAENIWTAYCEVTPAVERGLLRLPGEFGLSGTPITATESSRAMEPAAANDAPSLEQLHAIAWSLRHPTPVTLGSCDALSKRVAQALAADPQKEDTGLQVAVDLAAAMDPNAGPVAGVVGDSGRPGNAVFSGSGRYLLVGDVSHHTSCPGQYIVGQVIGADGAPRAGVHIVLVDQWGNRANAISKDGATDFGNYDFPLNDFANQYTLTVVDEEGQPISPPVVVDHNQGDSGDAPCHTVIWREQ